MIPTVEDSNIERQAAQLLIDSQNPSVAYLQRHLRLGYASACALMERLQMNGIVTAADENGYRRLTPEHEKIATQVFNEWRVFPNTEGAPLEGLLLDVSAAVAAARPFCPSLVSFYRENGLPYIEVEFPAVIAPATVIEMGLELEHSFGSPVYLVSLQQRRIEYIVEGSFLLPAGVSYTGDPFESLRLPLAELAQAWGIGLPALAS